MTDAIPSFGDRLRVRPPRGDDGLFTVTPVKSPQSLDVPHPFPYQGSKRALAYTILQYLPDDTTALIEPFAGSAAVSIAARYASFARHAVINDVNAPLMGMWSAILGAPDELADRYEAMWNASLADPKKYFLAKRAEFNETGDPQILLYLLNRIVKGAVRYGQTGLFNQSADNRRLGARPDKVRDRIKRTSSVMEGAEFHSGSYESWLIDAETTDVVYLDPPYQGVSNTRDHRYMAGLVREDFERVLGKAGKNGVSYIISYDAVREDGRYGSELDPRLDLTHLHVVVGRSAQSTLSGGSDVTVESIYLSPALVDRLGGVDRLR